MTSRDFVYWFQGFLEVSEAKEINENQVQVIKNHLNLVFKHDIDPSYTTDINKQKEYKKIHDGVKPSHNSSGLDDVLRC